MAAIQVSVAAALRDPGALNAPTPLEMASVPVIATHPPENARSMRKVNANPVVMPPTVVPGTTLADWAEMTSAGAPPKYRCAIPVPMSASMETMNTYVGRLNAAPDSRTPRRFTNIKTTIAAAQSGTVLGASAGYTDVMAAMPLEIETETVRM